MSAGIDRPRGLQSHSGGSSEEQTADSPNQTKSKSGPAFLGLTRCAACYNHKARLRRGSFDGESSSSAEDSGPELDWESEEESSSSSSCSEKALSEMHEKPETEEASPEQDDAAEPESGGGEARGGTEETSESLEIKTRTKGILRRAPLVKSYSLPSSFPPHLLPLSLLPRPHTVVSTLHLQVLSQKQDNDPFYIVQKHMSQREEEKTEGGWREGINNPPPPLFQLHDNRLTWQQRSLPSLQPPHLLNQYQQPPPELSHQHHLPQPQHFAPFSAQGQRLPPPLPTLPMLRPPPLHPVLHPPLHPPLQTPNSSHTHLHALPPHPCWCGYRMQFPYTY